MADERQERLEALFHCALEIKDPAQRQEFLDRECKTDAALQAEVQHLLELNDHSACFLDGEAGPDAVTSDLPKEQAGPAGARPAYLKPSNYPGSLGRLGKYEVLEQIGRGGMGLVYRAVAPELRREVAIKIQKPSGYTDAAKLARFKTEARAVAQLDHPNIVRIYDLEVDHEPPYIVMELVRGRDLAQLVKANGPFAAQTATEYGIQAARALKAAHEAGIVHRDVKPQNLMLTPNREVKVLDLGLARIPAGPNCGSTDQINIKHDSGVAGSVEFMSPEQSVSLADATPQSDIYSLGCTLFWLVTGRPPYSAENPVETVLAHREAPRPSILQFLPADSTTRQLDAILQQMMASKPEDRPPDMQAVNAALAKIIDEAAEAARRKKRVTYIAAGALVACTLLIGLIWRLLPPKYEFDLAAVSDLYEVRALAKLVAEINQVQAWKADYGTQGRAIARTIIANPSETSFRSFILPGSKEVLGDINKGLAVLDRMYNGTIPAAWRKSTAAELEKQIAQALRERREEDVRFRVGLLLNKDSSKSVLQRWGIADFPSDRYPDRQDRWIAALKKSLLTDIGPKAAWYEQILRTDAIEFESATGLVAVFRPKREEIVFRGEQSTANFELWLRFDDVRTAASPGGNPEPEPPQSDRDRKQSVEVDTGVRLIDCGLAQGADGKVLIRWPSATGIIDNSKFENLLWYLNMPQAFDTRDVRLIFDTQAQQPKLAISFEFIHEDLGSSRGKGLIAIDTASPELLVHDSQLYKSTLRLLPGMLKDLKSFRGFPVQIRDGAEAGKYLCELTAGKLPAFDMQVTFDDQWRLRFSGVPSVRTRETLASAICDQSESLSGMAAFCRIDSFEFDKSSRTLVGNMSFRLPGEAAEGPKSRWSIDGAGKLTVVISPQTRETVSRKHTQLVALKKRSLDRGEIETQVRESVSKFPQLAGRVELASVTSSEIGSYYSLGLSIGDWPALRLGPIEVHSLSEIDASVKQALSSASVMEAANSQWQTDERHPRFGRSTAQLHQWDSQTAIGIVKTTMLLTDDRFPLEVLERVRMEGGEVVLETHGVDGSTWVASRDYALSQSLKPSINQFCNLVSNAIQGTTSFRVKVNVDDQDLTEPWLQLSPPRVRLQGSVLVPLINTEFGFGRIELGQDSISLPKAIIVQPRVSFYTTHFTVSDPSCEIDWERRSIELGLKMTPPCPPVPVGSLSGAELSTYQASGLPPSDIRWDNLCLHAGHFGIRADARAEHLGASGSNRTVFGAESDLVLFNDIHVAQGRGEISLRDWQLEKLGMRVDGELNLIESKLGSLHAHLQVVPNDNMTLSGLAEVAGFGLQGDMRYNSQAAPVTVDIAARTKLEVLRIGFEADIRGSSDLAFEHYNLSAGGSIPWPLSAKRLFYKLTSDPSKTKFDWWWQTPDGRTVHYVTEAPRIDLFDREQLQQELMVAVARSLAPELTRIVLPAEVADPDPSASGLAESSTDTKPESAVEAQLVSDQYDNPSITVVVQEDTLRVVSAESPEREYGRLTAKDAGIESWERVTFSYGWTPQDEIFVSLLRPSQPAVPGLLTGYLFKKDKVVERQAVRSPSDLMEFAQRNGVLSPDDQSPGHRLVVNAVGQALKMNADGYESVDIEYEKGRGLVAGTSNEFGDITHAFFLDSAGQSQRLSLFGLTPAERELALHEFSSGIPDMADMTSAQSFGNFLVAIDRSNGKTHCALIQRETRDTLGFHIATDNGAVRYGVHRVDKVPPWQLYRTAGQLARSLWRVPVSGPAELYIGHGGACLVEHDGWRIMPLEDEDGATSAEFAIISRDSFVNWAPAGIDPLPSVDLLPQVLRDPKAREKADAAEIAKQCVTRWQQLKSQSASDRRWHAHPMGLLSELAAAGNPAAEPADSN